MLVVATSGTGFALGSGSTIDLAGLCWTCTGTMMVAASANSLNQVRGSIFCYVIKHVVRCWYFTDFFPPQLFEISNDAKMKRTMRRPLPSGRISVPHAVTWASSVGVAGTALLAWKVTQ